MVNYEFGKIYKIISDKTSDIYIGSTSEPMLSRRIQCHKTHYKMYCEEKYHYITSFEVLKFDDAEIILLENFPCESRNQLKARERHYIDELECVNKFIPTRTNKEYKQIEKCKEYNRKYYDENKDKMKDYYQSNKSKIKERNDVNCICECGRTIRHGEKSEHVKSMIHKKYLNTIMND